MKFIGLRTHALPVLLSFLLLSLSAFPVRADEKEDRQAFNQYRRSLRNQEATNPKQAIADYQKFLTQKANPYPSVAVAVSSATFAFHMNSSAFTLSGL